MREIKGKLIPAASFIGIIFMLGIYFYSLPEFLLSTKGTIFAAAWLAFAVLMLWAHSLVLLKNPRRIVKPELKARKQSVQIKIKDTRAGKNIRAARAMRG